MSEIVIGYTCFMCGENLTEEDISNHGGMYCWICDRMLENEHNPDNRLITDREQKAKV